MEPDSVLSWIQVTVFGTRFPENGKFRKEEPQCTRIIGSGTVYKWKFQPQVGLYDYGDNFFEYLENPVIFNKLE